MSISHKIAKAIIEIHKSVTRTAPDAKNKHANYKYLSIDGYYDLVRSLLSKNGIAIACNEVSSKVENNLLHSVFSFTIVHEDGDIWEAGKRSVVLPYLKGGQTSGAALSYAEKFFMRSTFKISTGEVDHADTGKAGEDGVDSMPPELYCVYDEMGERGTFTTIKSWGTSITKQIKQDNSLFKYNEQEIKRVAELVERNEVKLTKKDQDVLRGAIAELLNLGETIEE